MNLADVVRAMLRGDGLVVRAWIAAAQHVGDSWTSVPRPDDLGPSELAVAAGFVELMASRAGCDAPAWTAAVGAAPETIFLVASARVMPRTRRLCETEGPEPFRKRGILALPNCYTTA